jgi:murein DD-endopeptidase MepM/ murein hydrolase activator NlpD
MMAVEITQGRMGHKTAQDIPRFSHVSHAPTGARRSSGAGKDFFRAFFCQKKALLWTCLVLLTATSVSAQRIEIDWPTPNAAWERGQSFENWVQPTVSGDPRSGLWGSVRSHGTQFHEGLDIKPVSRDARGEPRDQVTAAMDGIVRNISARGGDSNYGRYIVIEHPGVTPAVYTLYAHLARIEPGVTEGGSVRRGQVIGTMGHTSNGNIPTDRAHLHFEIGLMLTENFQAWYTWKKFGSPNLQGRWNGMNLMGIDPRDFLDQWRQQRVDNFQQYFAWLEPAVRLRVVTSMVPDFIRRYPALLRKPIEGLVGGWDVQGDVSGLPFAWTPLSPTQVAGQRAGSVEILSVDTAALRGFRGKSLIRVRSGRNTPGPDLTTMLQLVFGLR